MKRVARAAVVSGTVIIATAATARRSGRPASSAVRSTSSVRAG